MPKLGSHRYGKARVRVLKILRNGETHTIKEIEVAALLKGDFETSYTAGDNSKVVPTDTIKNTINVLAKQHLGDEIELFAQILGKHFIDQYQQVRSAEITVDERAWQRLQIDDEPHPHAFQRGSDARVFTRVRCDANSCVVRSGIRGLVVLKSTESGFEGYPKCDFTTLRETADRILATSFTGTWTYAKTPADYSSANAAILAAMLRVFATRYSPSAQTTLFQMGEAALASCAEICRLELAMPNKHCLLIDLSPFGLTNNNEVFVPIEEPHGQIEAIIERDD